MRFQEGVGTGLGIGGIMGEDGMLEGQVGEGEVWEEQSDWDQARRLRPRGSDAKNFLSAGGSRLVLGVGFITVKTNNNTLSSLK